MATKLEGGGLGLSGRATKKKNFFAASLDWCNNSVEEDKDARGEK